MRSWPWPRRRSGALVIGLPLGALAVSGLLVTMSPATPAAGAGNDASGPTLFATQCASCHGTDGQGVDDRGPTLVGEGEAAADFVLRTGRMPMANPDAQTQRGPVRFTEDEIVALVEYVGSFGGGPRIPVVDPAAGDVVAGGVTYRLECAACHTSSGAGAVIGGGREAPGLAQSSATAIGEAIVVGPGAMPRFTALSDRDIDDVAAYIGRLQAMDTTAVDDFGGAGPVAEGLSAWLLALLPIVALTRWIGSPHEGRDRAVTAGDGPGEVDD